MAIRFDASAESAGRTANLPTNTGFTMMCWAMIATDRNASSVFMHYGATAVGAASSKTLETNSDGTTLLAWDGSTSVTGTNLNVGQWYHLAMTYDNANLRAYVNGVLDIANADVGNGPTGCVRFGNDETGNNEWLNGLIHGIKIWSAVLTQAEIQQEMQQIAPVRLATLNSWYPCEGNLSAMLQEGGRQYPGRVENLLVSAGTLAYEQGPLVPWQQIRGRKVWDVPAAAAGGLTWGPLFGNQNNRLVVAA